VRNIERVENLIRWWGGEVRFRINLYLEDNEIAAPNMLYSGAVMCGILVPDLMDPHSICFLDPETDA
jgi:hypothetical protein